MTDAPLVYLVTLNWNRPGDTIACLETAASQAYARLRLLADAEGILLEEAPIIPLYHYTRVYLKSPRVGGWRSNLLGYVPFKNLHLEEPGGGAP